MNDFIGLIILNFVMIIVGIITYNVEQNYLIGVRTTDTLSDKRVWDKANKLAGKLFIITGIISLLISIIFYLLNLKEYIIKLLNVYLAILLIDALLPAIYAHNYAKKLKRGEEEKPLILKRSFNYILIVFSIILIIIGFILPFTKPNPIIGVRIPKTFENPNTWKLINTISGIFLIIFGSVFTYIFYKLLNKEDLLRTKLTIKIGRIFIILFISISILIILLTYLI